MVFIWKHGQKCMLFLIFIVLKVVLYTLIMEVLLSNCNLFLALNYGLQPMSIEQISNLSIYSTGAVGFLLTNPKDPKKKNKFLLASDNHSWAAKTQFLVSSGNCASSCGEAFTEMSQKTHSDIIKDIIFPPKNTCIVWIPKRVRSWTCSLIVKSEHSQLAGPLQLIITDRYICHFKSQHHFHAVINVLNRKRPCKLSRQVTFKVHSLMDIRSEYQYLPGWSVQLHYTGQCCL